MNRGKHAQITELMELPSSKGQPEHGRNISVAEVATVETPLVRAKRGSKSTDDQRSDKPWAPHVPDTCITAHQHGQPTHNHQLVLRCLLPRQVIGWLSRCSSTAADTCLRKMGDGTTAQQEKHPSAGWAVTAEQQFAVLALQKMTQTSTEQQQQQP